MESLTAILRKGTNYVGQGMVTVGGLFAIGSLIYSLGIASILPESKINRFPREHPEIIEYYNAESDWERIVVEDNYPNIKKTIQDYQGIRNEDLKYMGYMGGGLVFMLGGVILATTIESKEENNDGKEAQE